jgi:hypothetical protein
MIKPRRHLKCLRELGDLALIAFDLGNPEVVREDEFQKGLFSVSLDKVADFKQQAVDIVRQRWP